MAEGDLLVTISGAALSLLFFENMRSVGDQMGFLLGEALEFVVKTYTDSDNQVETVKIHINVETIVTCPLSDVLHDSTGRINKERLKDFVHDKSKHVIGWFRFRRNTSSLVPTLKDKLLHKQFISHFSGSNGCREDFFLICLLNTSTSETRGTHKFRHVFLRRKRGMFEPIPLRINNLGDDASRYDGSDYKPTPTRKLARAPDGFSELIESLNLDVMRMGGLDSAMTIQQTAESHLTSLIPKVCESDLEVSELEQQVRELRMKIATQRLADKSKINGENYAKGSPRKNSFMESTRKNETNKIGNDASCVQREHISTSCAQSISSQRGPCRNTAACIAKSVTQEKSRQIGTNNLGTNNQQGAQEQQSFSSVVSSRNRRTSGIIDITSESICSEANEASCVGGVGRGRGSGGRAHEFIPAMNKPRRSVSSTAHYTRERSTTTEQDFSDAPGNSPNSPISRSLSQATKKNLDNPRNMMDSLDI